jgi:dihydrofolate synthase/folylpolyglutamate synthase
MPSTYERLESLERIGVKLGLRNIKTVLEALDRPDLSYPSILIAGTNGKGSVGAMLESILFHHRYRTGWYTSPHLMDLRERIKINREIISEKDFETSLSAVLSVIDKLTSQEKLENTPTYFETLTATAFHHFRTAKIDIAIIEVGLGGRFDATNAVEQKLSVITSIDFDHEEFLGKSLAQIATEKAGIIKSNSQTVTGVLPPEAFQVMMEVAQQKKSALFSSTPSDCLSLRLENGFPVFDYQPWLRPVRVSLRGRHQAQNAAVALLASEVLQQSDFKIDRKIATEALADVRWPGRLEMVSEDPIILLDCAHNPAGVDSLSQFLEDMRWPACVCLFTAMRDKKITSMLQRIAPKLESVVLTRVEPLNRCATHEHLAQACMSSNLAFEYVLPVDAAFQRARQLAINRNQPLVIFGSIYLIGEILRLLPASKS